MKILITGNLGYIGSVLTNRIDKKKFEIVGLDTGFYKDCHVSEIKSEFRQIFMDLRNIAKKDVKGYDGIIHLASLSNDPLGELKPDITHEINYKATIKLAKLAKISGIKRFVYASSQSMFGVSDKDEELDEDNSDKKPITTYAKTKWNAEIELRKLSDNNFIVSCFRPSTVFGSSPRLRCDIVFNHLLASAYTLGKIEILSDGTPWRPVIHINDVCDAFLSGLVAPQNLVGGEAFNVGFSKGNFTVFDLAKVAQRLVAGCEIVVLGRHTDARTYKVNFNKILTTLKDYFNPNWDLDNGGQELIEYFKEINFSENMFRNRYFKRLNQLEYLKKNNLIDDNLRWI